MIATDAIFGRKTKSGVGPINWTAEWRLEENSGKAILDSSGNNLHLSHAKDLSVMTYDGKVGKAINFSGQTSANIGHHPILDITDGTTNLPFTIIFWFKYFAASSLEWFLTKGSSWKTDYELLIHQNLVKLWMYNANGQLVEIAAIINNTGPNYWHQIAIAVDPYATPFGRYFLNGAEQQVSLSGDPTMPFLKSSSPLAIGGRSYVNDVRFNGALDEVRIKIGRALSAEELLEIYNSEK